MFFLKVPAERVCESEIELQLKYDGVRCVDANYLELMFTLSDFGLQDGICVSLFHDDVIALIAQLVKWGDLEPKGIFANEVKALLETWKKSGGTHGQL